MREAPLWSVQYAIRKPLLHWLRSHELGGHVLDVGCGDRRYERFVQGEYVGFDVPANALADLHGTIEAIPVEDASFDAVLCLQVLEHVPDPAAAVRELRRVVRPGGLVLASTHGLYPYHPNPEDLWRWTHAGLERLFRDNGDWSSIGVTPGSGTSAAVALLCGYYVDLLFKRLHARWLGAPIVAANNVAGRFYDRMIGMLRDPTVPGTIFANYHVEAVA